MNKEINNISSFKKTKTKKQWIGLWSATGVGAHHRGTRGTGGLGGGRRVHRPPHTRGGP